MPKTRAQSVSKKVQVKDLDKKSRHALYAHHTSLNQYFRIERSPSSKSICRLCKLNVVKNALRFTHIVCNNKCFTEKNTGIKDGCGKYHFDCFLDKQLEERERWKSSNEGWTPVVTVGQIAGVEELSEEDRGVLDAKLEGLGDKIENITSYSMPLRSINVAFNTCSWNETDRVPFGLTIPIPTGGETIDHLQNIIRFRLAQLAPNHLITQVANHQNGGIQLTIPTSTAAIRTEPNHPVDYYEVFNCFNVVWQARLGGKDIARLFVKTLTGKIVEVKNLRPEDPLTVVKRRIQDQEGIPPDQMRLIFDGKQLEDERRLEEYEIETGSILHLV